MKNLIQSLVTPAVLILCTSVQLTLLESTQRQSEAALIICGLFCLYTFVDVYASLTTKNQ
jgi:hypothetical protein